MGLNWHYQLRVGFVEYLKTNYGLEMTTPVHMAIIGFPLSLLYISSVKYMVAHFDGEKWPSRLMGFAIGAIVFTVMSWVWFKEPMTLKTGICLILSLCIMLIQLFWK